MSRWKQLHTSDLTRDMLREHIAACGDDITVPAVRPLMASECREIEHDLAEYEANADTIAFGSTRYAVATPTEWEEAPHSIRYKMTTERDELVCLIVEVDWLAGYRFDGSLPCGSIVETIGGLYQRGDDSVWRAVGRPEIVEWSEIEAEDALTVIRCGPAVMTEEVQ